MDNRQTMADNILYYLSLNNKTKYEAAQDLGLPLTTFCSWANGKAYPRIDKIEMLAEYFHIDKADLINPKGQKVELELTAEDKEVLTMLHDPKYHDLLLNYYKKLVELKKMNEEI